VLAGKLVGREAGTQPAASEPPGKLATTVEKLCLQAFEWVDPENAQAVNQSQTKTALTMVFSCLKVPNPPDEWHTAAFQSFDTDHDGLIGFDDLVDLACQHCEAFVDDSAPSLDEAVATTTDTTNQTAVIDEAIKLESSEKVHPAATKQRKGSITSNMLPRRGPAVRKTHFAEEPEVTQYEIAEESATVEPRGSTDSAKSELWDSNMCSSIASSISSKQSDTNHLVSKQSDTPPSRRGSVPIASRVMTPAYRGSLKVFTDYSFLEAKGGGAFGKVVHVQHNLTGLHRACKSIAIRSPKQIAFIETEVALMRKLDHPGVLRLFESYYDGSHNIYMIIELCPGGSLTGRLQSNGGVLPEPEAARVTREMLAAVNYCHNRGAVHRDIKPDNLLFTHSGPMAPLKVIDFGLSEFWTRIERKSSLQGNQRDQMLPRTALEHPITWPQKSIPKPSTPARSIFSHVAVLWLSV